MDITELQELLKEMPLSDGVKQEILDRQAAGDATEAILDLIDAKLDEAEREIIKDNPELLAEYSKLQEEYNKEVMAAAADFDKEMDAIEAETKALDEEIGKDIDQARMEELKEEQQQIAG